jgi:crotonobetainyl-CoA:carnitine CoA-transferase CaiB-like acyl-CoA transferase
MAKALDGVRILDLSRVLAGPWATQLLGDLGAEVIKVEKPGEGDDTRHWGPPYVQSADGAHREAAYFLSANRGKQSVAVNLGSPEGAALIRQLAAQCDVLVENFRVGGLARFGLDYASLREVNPGLVYCSITGFGQDGPYAERAGYDFVIQAMGGLMSVTGEAEGEPMKAGVALVDIMTGLYASNAILAALRHRDRTGEGQQVDLALLDVQVAVMANQALNYLATGRDPKRYGNAHPNIVPYQAFSTADGALTVAIGNDAQFRRLCEVMGAPELGTDARFAGNGDRVRNRDALIPLLQQIFSTAATAEWLARILPADLPAGPINSLREVFEDEQVKHRGLRLDLPHPDLGSVPGVASPIRLSETPVVAEAAPPPLGRHTREVLERLLGLTPERLDALEKSGVIGWSPPQ